MRSTGVGSGVAFMTFFPTDNHLPLPMRRVKYLKRTQGKTSKPAYKTSSDGSEAQNRTSL